MVSLWGSLTVSISRNLLLSTRRVSDRTVLPLLEEFLTDTTEVRHLVTVGTQPVPDLGQLSRGVLGLRLLSLTQSTQHRTAVLGQFLHGRVELVDDCLVVLHVLLSQVNLKLLTLDSKQESRSTLGLTIDVIHQDFLNSHFISPYCLCLFWEWQEKGSNLPRSALQAPLCPASLPVCPLSDSKDRKST